jgi:hypothetical protein
VSQNGCLMSRRGCSLPANASGVDPHRASITSRFGQVGAAGFQAQGGGDGGECASGRSSGGRQGCRVAQAGGDGLRHRGGTPAAAAAVHALRQGGGRCCCCRCRRRPKGGAGGAATATPGQAPSAQPLVTTGRRLAGISGPERCSDRKHPVGEHMSWWPHPDYLRHNLRQPSVDVTTMSCTHEHLPTADCC